jgi:hypothetical protein
LEKVVRGLFLGVEYRTCTFISAMNVSSGGQLWDFSSRCSTGLAPSFQAVKISTGGQLESPNPSETGTVESFVRL